MARGELLNPRCPRGTRRAPNLGNKCATYDEIRNRNKALSSIPLKRNRLGGERGQRGLVWDFPFSLTQIKQGIRDEERRDFAPYRFIDKTSENYVRNANILPNMHPEFQENEEIVPYLPNARSGIYRYPAYDEDEEEDSDENLANLLDNTLESTLSGGSSDEDESGLQTPYFSASKQTFFIDKWTSYSINNIGTQEAIDYNSFTDIARQHLVHNNQSSLTFIPFLYMVANLEENRYDLRRGVSADGRDINWESTFTYNELTNLRRHAETFHRIATVQLKRTLVSFLQNVDQNPRTLYDDNQIAPPAIEYLNGDFSRNGQMNLDDNLLQSFGEYLNSFDADEVDDGQNNNIVNSLPLEQRERREQNGGRPYMRGRRSREVQHGIGNERRSIRLSGRRYNLRSNRQRLSNNIRP